MIVEFEWFPAWKDALTEDESLQEKAADRLAEYLNNGELWMNGKRLRLAAAETTRKTKSKEGSFGVRYSIEVDVKVSA